MLVQYFPPMPLKKQNKTKRFFDVIRSVYGDGALPKTG